MEQYYYPLNGQTYSSDQMLSLWGLNVETAALSTLNRRGFYPVQATSPYFDTALYEATYTWSIIPIAGGEGAERVWVPVPLPLPQAKAAASEELKSAANAAVNAETCACGFSGDMLTGVASMAEDDRPARYRAELESIATIASTLDSDLSAVETATSVDEINNIVNRPGGILFTGRGSGLGPEDLNVSYYVEFNSASMTEAETELYIPGTDIVISYGSYPDGFDSMGDCFIPGNYIMQIREVATGRVIAEFEVPYNPEGQDVPF